MFGKYRLECCHSNRPHCFIPDTREACLYSSSMNPHNKKPPVGKSSSHQVRIIGGSWKRTPLSVITAEGLRPTPDRVRETVFNWLNHLLDGNWQNLRCLDLYAGSGALGFEAASRGAVQVTLVELNTAALRQLEQVKEKLGAAQTTLIRGDAIASATSLLARRQSFDLIFLDPPFGQALLPKILPLCAKLLSPKGLLYVEAEHALNQDFFAAAAPENADESLAGWSVLRADQAGSVFFHILQRNISLPELPEIQA